MKYEIGRCSEGGWGVWKLVYSCVPNDWMLLSWHVTRKEAINHLRKRKELT